MSTTHETPKRTFVQPIHARAVRSGFHFYKMILLGLVVFGYAGCFFLYDGFVRYPRMNARIATLDAEKSRLEASHGDDTRLAEVTRERKNLSEHTAFDLLLQRVIGGVCVPLGIFVIVRHLRTVSGEYVLADDVLALPDGRRVPIDSISGVQDAKWDAKALATFAYRTPDGGESTFKLDSLAFETPETDAIHDAIVARLPKSS